MEAKKSKLSVLLAGFIKENPVFVLLLGTCPTLAVSKTVVGGLGMGLAVIVVLTCSNLVISLLKNIIPDKVRIPAYIVVIAGFVTMVEMLIHAYAPAIYEVLGIYLPLIVVNCIILGRAEMFASQNSVIDSVLDGIGMGIGFTIAIVAMASVRELLGSGTWMGIEVFSQYIEPMKIIVDAPGGFFVYGIIIAFINKITKGKGIKRDTINCQGCMQKDGCAVAGKEGA